jgi:hypothetical protein
VSNALSVVALEREILTVIGSLPTTADRRHHISTTFQTADDGRPRIYIGVSC